MKILNNTKLHSLLYLFALGLLFTACSSSNKLTHFNKNRLTYAKVERTKHCVEDEKSNEVKEVHFLDHKTLTAFETEEESLDFPLGTKDLAPNNILDSKGSTNTFEESSIDYSEIRVKTFEDEPEEDAKKVREDIEPAAITALILGLVSLLFLASVLFFPPLAILVPFVSIVGIVFGIIGLKRSKVSLSSDDRLMSMIGLISSIVSLVLSILVVGLFVLFLYAVLTI